MPALLENLGVSKIHKQTRLPGFLCRSPNLPDLKDIYFKYLSLSNLVFFFSFLLGKFVLGVQPLLGPRR